MDEDKKKNLPWSFKHKDFKAYITKIWKQNPHLRNRAEVSLKIFREHEQIPKLKQERDEYKSIVEFVSKESSKDESTLQETLENKYPCLSRFKHEGSFFCVPRKGKAIRLETLKICSACSGRLVKESEVEVLHTRQYMTCGAKEKYDKKKGLMFYCEKDFQGQYVTLKDCKTTKCTFLKEVKVQQ